MIFFVLNMNSIGNKHRILTFYFKLDSLFKEKDYREYETYERFYNNNNTDINNFLEWKKNFKLGIAIKQNWKSLCLKKNKFIPNFEQDSEQICEEIYSTLKGTNIKKFTYKIYYFFKICLIFITFRIFDCTSISKRKFTRRK